MTIGLAMMPPVAAHASDTWPGARPITWYVGFAPGGSVDVITRAVAQRVGAAVGQTIVIENRPGGSGGIAMAAAARAAPDGYTLVTMAGPILHANPVPEIGRELEAVGALAEGAVVLVGPGNGPKTFGDLVQAIEKNPGGFSYASSGVGTGQHIAGEMFNLALGADMVHVPYKGGSQAIADVLGGQVQLGFLGVSTVVDQVRAGRLTAYAVTTPQRSAALPDVPSMQEAGVAGFELAQWYIAAVPSGTPAPVVEKLNAAIQDALRSAELQNLLSINGLVPGEGSPAEAAALVQRSLERAGEVARQASIELQ